MSDPFESRVDLKLHEYRPYLDQKITSLINKLGFNDTSYFVDDQHFGNAIADFDSAHLQLQVVFDRGFPSILLKPKRPAWDWFLLAYLLRFVDPSYDFRLGPEEELQQLQKHFKAIDDLLATGDTETQETLSQFATQQFRETVERLVKEP